jgi:hypothetical protein
VSLAVTVEVAPAVPTPPKMRGCHVYCWVAVCVEAPVAVSVTVVVAIAEWWKLPTMVPVVNGELRTSGESIESVLVMLALDGTPVYVATHVGFVTVCPSSSDPAQPVKELIVNPPPPLHKFP